MSYEYNTRNVPSDVEETKINMVYKEFWFVDTRQNNIRELQKVLDSCYNDYENCYSAEVFNSQNTSRLVIKCNLCNAILSSYDPFISHNNGKSHKKLVNQACHKKDHSNADFQIIRFKSIAELENPFENGTLEFELFETSHDVIGYQFLYREIYGKKESFTCQLCASLDRKSIRMKQNRAFKHITSEDHITQYLEVKFDTRLKNAPFGDLQKYVDDVKNKEGKIQCKILSIENTDESEKHRSNIKDKSDSARDSDSSGSGSQAKSLPLIKMENVDDFMSLTNKHLDHIRKHNGDNITAELQTDIEAVDLLIGTSKVLAQKIYVYSLDGHRSYVQDAKALLSKSELLKPIMGDANDSQEENKN